MASIRLAGAIAAGKLAGVASRAFGRGGGTALPGVIAEKIEPRLVERLAAQLGRGAVMVTGTNGKTTTAHMLSSVATNAGWAPLHNRSGSNLMRGVATALLWQAGVLGGLSGAERRLGVLEVDEATLPEAVAAVKPRVLIFTNLFRDQLDRYGEVDSIAARWRESLQATPESTTVVLNADDPSVAALEACVRGRVVFYGIDDGAPALDAPEHAADSRWCPDCGREYEYDLLFYGHVGHWRCPGCDRKRREPDVTAKTVRLEADGTRMIVATPQGEVHLSLALSGLYNAYNALAALAGGLVLGIEPEAVREGIESVSAAFGRQEQFEIDGRQVQVFLSKNPAGLNQVLRTLASIPGDKRLLLLLNDDIADGRDVSWIWDADFELLAGRTASVVASGRRAEDMALRLKYAGFPADVPAISDAGAALALSFENTPAGEKLYVLPTYTAMLEIREALAKLGGVAPFWEEQS